MSKYTTEVRFICESKAGLTESAGFNSVNEIITTAAPYIFNFNFPIYDETYRLPLETRILKHYYTREICEETFGLWQLRLEDRLNLIMPYYNKLYESALLQFNPFYDVDLTTNRSGNKNDSRSASDNRQTSRLNTGNESENLDENLNRKESNIQNGNTSTEKIGSGATTLKDSNTESENINKNGTSNRESTEQNKEINSKNTNANNNGWDLFSDKPQSGLDGIAAGGSSTLANNGYLSSARNQYGSNNSTETNRVEGDKSASEDITTQDDQNRIRTGLSNKEENKNENYNENINRNDIQNRNSEDSRISNRDSNYNRVESEKTSGDEVSNITSLENYAEHVVGKRGGISYSKMLEEFRKTFLKIDQMILDELSDLFFGLW